MASDAPTEIGPLMTGNVISGKNVAATVRAEVKADVAKLKEKYGKVGHQAIYTHISLSRCAALPTFTSCAFACGSSSSNMSGMCVSWRGWRPRDRDRPRNGSRDEWQSRRQTLTSSTGIARQALPGFLAPTLSHFSS